MLSVSSHLCKHIKQPFMCLPPHYFIQPIFLLLIPLSYLVPRWSYVPACDWILWVAQFVPSSEIMMISHPDSCNSFCSGVPIALWAFTSVVEEQSVVSRQGLLLSKHVCSTSHQYQTDLSAMFRDFPLENLLHSHLSLLAADRTVPTVIMCLRQYRTNKSRFSLPLYCCGDLMSTHFLTKRATLNELGDICMTISITFYSCSSSDKCQHVVI